MRSLALDITVLYASIADCIHLLKPDRSLRIAPYHIRFPQGA
jgi:hypothetical protein